MVLFFSFISINLFSLNMDLINSHYYEKDGRNYLSLPLADSYEYQILNGEGALRLEEYKQIFIQKEISVYATEIQRKLMVFDNEDSLRQWILSEMLPINIEKENIDQFVNDYINAVKERGYLDFGDGKIRFPRKKLLVILD